MSRWTSARDLPQLVWCRSVEIVDGHGAQVETPSLRRPFLTVASRTALVELLAQDRRAADRANRGRDAALRTRESPLGEKLREHGHDQMAAWGTQAIVSP